MNDQLKEWCRSIADSEDAGKRFREIVENNVPENQKDFIEQVYADYTRNQVTECAALVIGPLNYLMIQNDDEDVFYERLWRYIDGNELIDGREMLEIALAVVISSPSIPYHQAYMITMDEGEYSARTKALSSKARDLIGMSQRPFAQKTQGAAAMLDIVNSENDERDRAILMVALVEHLRKGGLPMAPSAS